ncbi:hydrogenase maturation protease [Bryocella elongata]|uniref:Hydrogenase maturation protease n=1 Tax=Bryocella elongata TaxID=863522 RepID=A0A1H5S1T8_9BACT|nr:hydrogenase maturation protease [Bryocella elongata]SEF44314.1 hydrogenase maturation protease [Bryocella elongata]
MTTISVIGLGNIFLGDDGFGPVAIESFRCEYEWPPHVDVLDLGTPGLDLAPYLYDKELVVMVDAVHADAAVGTLSIFQEEDFVSQRAKLRITGHDPGLWETLAHLRLAGHAPSELIIVGVNPKACNFADGISDEVWSTASRASEMIAILLLERGIACFPRRKPGVPNLWWLRMLSADSSAELPGASTNA